METRTHIWVPLIIKRKPAYRAAKIANSFWTGDFRLPVLSVKALNKQCESVRWLRFETVCFFKLSFVIWLANNKCYWLERKCSELQLSRFFLCMIKLLFLVVWMLQHSTTKHICLYTYKHTQNLIPKMIFFQFKCIKMICHISINTDKRISIRFLVFFFDKYLHWLF